MATSVTIAVPNANNTQSTIITTTTPSFDALTLNSPPPFSSNSAGFSSRPSSTLRRIHPPPFPSPSPKQSITLSVSMPPPPVPSQQSRKRKLPVPRSSTSSMSARESSPSSQDVQDDEDDDDEEEEDDEYDPRGAASTSTRTGAGNSSRARRTVRPSAASGSAPPPPPPKSGGRTMSREALRKANHSLIERRRREKINYALGELRSMVPGLGEDGGKGGEFKLEVLERTVVHMRELKRQIAELEARRSSLPAATAGGGNRGGNSARASRPTASLPRKTSSNTPPSPSITPPMQLKPTLSPDPNETEAELDLPPALAVAASRTTSTTASGGGTTASDSSSGRTASPHPPSIASLLASANSQREGAIAPRPTPTPPAMMSAPNPTLYLPFPTPSPTSPFLTYHPSSASTASSTTGPAEPSPFMAPLSNFSLFGGALDPAPSPLDDGGVGAGLTASKHSPPDLKMPPPSTGRDIDMAPEEAANLLLAFSSPDTLRPQPTGSTPLMSALAMPQTSVNGNGHGRRLTLETEDFNFTLDGGVASVSEGNSNHTSNVVRKQLPVGKTARDILRM